MENLFEKSLSNEFNTLSKNEIIDKEIPKFIIDNLNSSFPLREYQKEAIARFIYYYENYIYKKSPVQLLYHMATGSGKTLIMASLILYLYKKGYRKFLFFVNQTNIIEKTKDNFLNKTSSKYLFYENIIFDNRKIRVNEVDNFQAVNEDDINIVFSTVQGLHFNMNNPKENSVTYEDFTDERIVMISDETHHINALTKSKLSKDDQREIRSWEGTVNRIFNQNRDNILLEFTATVELEHPKVLEKYYDKIIYEYSLKEFRLDGFSKEVNVLQADLSDEDRMLQAIILSQYRRKIAEKNGIYLKPVVLMKSRVIKESEESEKIFSELMRNLKNKDIIRIKERTVSEVIKDAFDYFEENDITMDNLVKELKEDFSDERCISVNSKNQSEEKQLIVNSLEDKENEIRIIFVVHMLNEGWDVLNLFDIVRLYDTRDARHGKPGKTTISEAQLIGRGARYFPFEWNENGSRFKRKFDEEPDNEMRIIEELYYHSAHNPRYIQEIRQALIDTGILPERTREIKLRVKDSFKRSGFWDKGLIFLNQQFKDTREDIFSLNDADIKRRYEYHLLTGYSTEGSIFEERLDLMPEDKMETYKIIDFGENVIRKGLNVIEFYKFSNLKKYFPNLSSISEFINSDKYISNVLVDVKGRKSQVENQEEKLEITLFVLSKIADEIEKGYSEFKGSKTFEPKKVSSLCKR
jgi:type III restriction enzyme